MFRRVYKQANDDIFASSELLDKILAQSGSNKAPRYTGYMRYGTLAAAVMIAVGTLAIYPSISKNINPGDNKKSGDVVVQSVERYPETRLSESLQSAEDLPALAENASVQPEASEISASTPKPAKTKEGSGKAEVSESTSAKTQNTPTTKSAPPADNSGYLSPSPTQEAVPDSVHSSDDTVEAASEKVQVQKSDSALQDAAAAVASAESIEETAPAYNTAEDAAPTKASSSSGGGSGGGSSSYSARTVQKISESEAKSIADNAFVADFGAEIKNTTQIKTEYSQYYKVTRYNDSVSYTVIVYNDGTIKKQY